MCVFLPQESNTMQQQQLKPLLEDKQIITSGTPTEMGLEPQTQQLKSKIQ